MVEPLLARCTSRAGSFLMERLRRDVVKISTCHFPIGFSPQECVVMKAQFVKPEEEKSCDTILQSTVIV